MRLVTKIMPQKTESPKSTELSSQYNYSQGMTYFYVAKGDRELGYFYRNPWGNTWVACSNTDNKKQEAVTQEEAIKLIETSWQKG